MAVALRNSAMLGACPSLAAHSLTAAITSSLVMVFSIELSPIKKPPVKVAPIQNFWLD
jgi:hypothetical protein